MEVPIVAATQHIRLMESRIAAQETTMERLKQSGQDVSAAVSQLRLLHAALAEMRLQLPQLIPTEEQMTAPVWALPLVKTESKQR